MGPLALGLMSRLLEWALWLLYEPELDTDPRDVEITVFYKRDGSAGAWSAALADLSSGSPRALPGMAGLWVVVSATVARDRLVVRARRYD